MSLSMAFSPRLPGGLALATLPLLVLTAARPAHAQTTLYSNRAAFLANSTGTTTLGFEGIAPDNGYTAVPSPPGLTLDGVNFSVNPTSANTILFVIGKNTYYPNNSVLSLQNTQSSTGDLLVTFSAPVTAIGLDFGDGSPTAQTDTFTLSDGQTFTHPTGAGQDLNFVGLTSAIPITSLDIQQPTDLNLSVDNFTFGQAAPVPESSTLVSFGLLLALGLGGAVVAARKKKAIPSA